jgi:hypothetical protein
MIVLELDRLRTIHTEFRAIYEDQRNVAEGLGLLLQDMDIGDVQNRIE